MRVERLAALDLHGVRGAPFRRRIVLTEFFLGVLVSVALGCWLLARAHSATGRAVGIWVLGAGLNYAPLAGYGFALLRPGALEAELAGVEIQSELRRYSVLQLWIFLPLSLVVLSARDVLTRRG
jgi:hypothetical protein